MKWLLILLCGVASYACAYKVTIENKTNHPFKVDIKYVKASNSIITKRIPGQDAKKTNMVTVDRGAWCIQAVYVYPDTDQLNTRQTDRHKKAFYPEIACSGFQAEIVQVGGDDFIMREK